MNGDFRGTGWRFPVHPDRDGAIALSSGDDDIDESIRIILQTRKGERVMRPDFGCGIHDYTFTVVNATTRTLIETSVLEALRKWEPRIEVQDVTASPANLDEGRLDVSIDYRVRSTNTETNLVYPFYLTE